MRHLKFVQGFQLAHENSDIQLATHIFHRSWWSFSTGDSWAAVAAPTASLPSRRLIRRR